MVRCRYPKTENVIKLIIYDYDIEMDTITPKLHHKDSITNILVRNPKQIVFEIGHEVMNG